MGLLEDEWEKPKQRNSGDRMRFRFFTIVRNGIVTTIAAAQSQKCLKVSQKIVTQVSASHSFFLRRKSCDNSQIKCVGKAQPHVLCGRSDSGGY
jgi:hypothetical protein